MVAQPARKIGYIGHKEAFKAPALKAPNAFIPITSAFSSLPFSGPSKTMQTIQLIHAVISELDHLHEAGKVHGNLTPDKILCKKVHLMDGVHWEVTIAEPELDFADPLSPYSAPEVTLTTTDQKEHDIYSLGVILSEALSGQKAFFGKTKVKFFEKDVFHQSLEERTYKPLLDKIGSTPWCWDLIESMLSTVPEKRPSSEDLMIELFEVFDASQPVVDNFGRPLVTIEKKHILSEKEIGRGACAITYLIEAKIGDKTVKIVRKKPLLTGDEARDQRMINALYAEYEAMSKPLDKKGGSYDDYSPFLVEAYRLGEETVSLCGKILTIPYIDMEYIEGYDLYAYIEDQASEAPKMPKLSAAEKIEIIIEVVEGLSNVHERGLIHRDVKPENIMIRKNDKRTKLFDFGASTLDLPHLTSYETSTGSPGYSAPEAVFASKSGKRGDLFALGITLFELLTERDALTPEYVDPEHIELGINWDKLLKDMENINSLIDALEIAGISKKAEAQLKHILKKATAFDYPKFYGFTRDSNNMELYEELLNGRYQNCDELEEDLHRVKEILAA
jgi:serine/threonine protein kinase